MHEDTPELAVHDGGPPPPIRRLVLDEVAATIVAPPPPGSILAPGAVGGTAPTVDRRLTALPASQVTERMRTEELRIAYAGKEAVKGVSLPIRRG